MIYAPIKTVSALNARDAHWRVRHRRVKSERASIGWYLNGAARPGLPCEVLLTRIAPSAGLDDDNLAGALKGIRDEVASWLGVDDRHRDQVSYRYAQRRGGRAEWAVQIDFNQIRDPRGQP